MKGRQNSRSNLNKSRGSNFAVTDHAQNSSVPSNQVSLETHSTSFQNNTNLPKLIDKADKNLNNSVQHENKRRASVNNKKDKDALNISNMTN